MWPGGEWMLKVRSPQDLGAGILFVLIGLAGVYFGQDLAFGSARRMGPGYFPVIISYMIICMGLIVTVRAFRVDGPAMEKFRLRPILMLVLALAAFGFLIAQLGVIISSFLMVGIAAYARYEKVNIVETIIFAIAVSAFMVLVFVYGLNQPMPLWWKS